MLSYSDFSRNRRKRKNYKPGHKVVGTFLLLVSIGCLFIFAPDKNNTVHSPAVRIFLTPVGLIQGIRNFAMNQYTSFMDNFSAKEKLVSLQEENRILREMNTEYRYKQRRLESYREALNLPRDEEYPAVPAIIVVRDDRLAPTLVINRGIQDGLSINMPVFNGDGLIGRTLRLSRSVARVQPITDTDSEIGVYVEGTSYEGIMRGSEDSRYLLLTEVELVSGGVDLITPQPGQKVYTSGRGLVFPRDLLAGTISEATTENGYIIEPAADIHHVQSVLVLTNTPMKQEILSLLSEEE